MDLLGAVCAARGKATPRRSAKAAARIATATRPHTVRIEKEWFERFMMTSV
jgi:hypothetical protein